MNYRVGDEYFWRLVKSCVKELKKSGLTFCFHIEQVREIIGMSTNKLAVKNNNYYYTITREGN